MMTHDEMIAVIAAHRDGKSLQIHHVKQWKDTTLTLDRLVELMHGNWHFRVKPEPQSIFIPLAHSGDLVKRYYETLTKLRAEWPDSEYKEFVEVVK
jgi:hypothetical protein